MVLHYLSPKEHIIIVARSKHNSLTARSTWPGVEHSCVHNYYVFHYHTQEKVWHRKKSTNQYKSTPNFKCNYFVHQVIIMETSKVTNQEYRKRYFVKHDQWCENTLPLSIAPGLTATCTMQWKWQRSNFHWFPQSNTYPSSSPFHNPKIVYLWSTS